MKKQIISLILCIGMILTLVPAFATTTETAPSLCNVLFEENFEGASPTMPQDITTGTGDESAVKTLADETANEDVSQAYGQGKKVLHLENSTGGKSLIPFGIAAENLKALVYGGTPGYKVEISFDWNPIDDAGAATNNIAVVCSRDTDGKANTDDAVTLKLVGGTSGAPTLTLLNRKESAVDDAIPLTTAIDSHVANVNHVYRARIIIEATDSTVDGSVISVYLDDVIMGSAFTNALSRNDRYLLGLYHYRPGNKTLRGTIDNIKVVEYGTGVTGTTSYINDDELVSAIRKWEYNLSSYEGAEQAKLSSALVEAKAAFEAENRTQATVDAAVTKLNDWQNQSEESEWSAEVSDAVGRKVTIKANEEITDGKIIVANYSGSYVVNATLPEFTGLAEGNEMEITIPESWTGEVRVFFWDTEHNALMDCEKLTIE